MKKKIGLLARNEMDVAVIGSHYCTANIILGSKNGEGGGVGEGGGGSWCL